jgi:hypothetical protein
MESLKSCPDVLPRDDCRNQDLMIRERGTHQHATIDQQLSFGWVEVGRVREVEDVVAMLFEPIVLADLLNVPTHVFACDASVIARVDTV